MLLNKDMLLEQYRQVNEHHREADRKRDIILGFYITLSVAMYGFALRIDTSDTLKIGFVDTLLFQLGILGLILLGFIVGLLCTIYRGWHGLIIIKEIVLQEMINKKKYDIEIGFIKNVKYKLNIFTSVELLMLILLNEVVAMH